MVDYDTKPAGPMRGSGGSGIGLLVAAGFLVLLLLLAIFAGGGGSPESVGTTPEGGATIAPDAAPAAPAPDAAPPAPNP